MLWCWLCWLLSSSALSEEAGAASNGVFKEWLIFKKWIVIFHTNFDIAIRKQYISSFMRSVLMSERRLLGKNWCCCSIWPQFSFWNILVAKCLPLWVPRCLSLALRISVLHNSRCRSLVFRSVHLRMLIFMLKFICLAETIFSLWEPALLTVLLFWTFHGLPMQTVSCRYSSLCW